MRASSACGVGNIRQITRNTCISNTARDRHIVSVWTVNRKSYSRTLSTDGGGMDRRYERTVIPVQLQFSSCIRRVDRCCAESQAARTSLIVDNQALNTDKTVLQSGPKTGQLARARWMSQYYAGYFTRYGDDLSTNLQLSLT